MEIKSFDLNKISSEFSIAWSPKDVSEVDNFVLRAAKFEGEYSWHSHENNDEMFIVFKGKIKIQTKNRDFILSEGEGITIPKGVEHCPVALVSSVVLMFERKNLE